jgi:hypothetical protein
MAGGETGAKFGPIVVCQARCRLQLASSDRAIIPWFVEPELEFDELLIQSALCQITPQHH